MFIVLSFVFGFMGVDHFYLRSFSTGLQKFALNMVSFGFWYFWDLIQIVTETKKVQEEGLNSPLDWIRGIGRGVFKPTPPVAGSTEYGPKKELLVYALLTLFFGIFGLDKFYIGEPIQGIAKLLTCFNIFIFLFNICY
jgi:TM2 domain-containing membrane protein YozV